MEKKKIEPFKMRVTPEQSEKVQKVLFENGYKWRLGSTGINYLHEPFLFFNNRDLTDMVITYGNCNEATFSNVELPEITFSDFMQKYASKELKSDIPHIDNGWFKVEREKLWEQIKVLNNLETAFEVYASDFDELVENEREFGLKSEYSRLTEKVKVSRESFNYWKKRYFGE